MQEKKTKHYERPITSVVKYHYPTFYCALRATASRYGRTANYFIKTLIEKALELDPSMKEIYDAYYEEFSKELENAGIKDKSRQATLLDSHLFTPRVTKKNK